jgi:hypothetical protein
MTTKQNTNDTLSTLGWYVLGAFILSTVLYGISQQLFFGVAVFLVSTYIYMLPSFIAWSNNHQNLASIIILNFFLGFTFIGWVVSMVWAVKK